MYQTKIEDPFTETNRLVREYMDRTGENSLHTAYAAVFRADPELKQRHESARQELNNHGGRIVTYGDPQAEATKRALEYAREQGLDTNDPQQLKVAYRETFAADPELYGRYENYVKGHREQYESEKREWKSEIGGAVQGASEEAMRRAKELMKEWRGTGLMDTLEAALKVAFKEDPQLYQRYEMETKGR